MWVEAWSTQRKIMNDKLLYRIPEVAEHLSISRSKVYELLNPARRSEMKPRALVARQGPLAT